jgi:hypothetical protein
VNGPGWLSGAFAALMLTVAVYCAGRLAVARWQRRPTELDTDAAHIVMGVAMAGMLVSGLRTLPSTLWEGVFAAGAAWFGYQTLRARQGAAPSPWRCFHTAPHLVECAAMLYMFLALPATVEVRSTQASMGAMPGSRFSFLALVLALLLLGSVVRHGDRLPPYAPARPAPEQGPSTLAPRCAILCKIAMGITMGYMLILTL